MWNSVISIQLKRFVPRYSIEYTRRHVRAQSRSNRQPNKIEHTAFHQAKKDDLIPGR